MGLELWAVRIPDDSHGQQAGKGKLASSSSAPGQTLGKVYVLSLAQLIQRLI
jgi:hypothetical protein